MRSNDLIGMLRYLLSMIVIWCCLLAPQNAFAFARNAASKAATTPGHLDEIAAVFMGYGKDPGFVELFDSVSTTIDRMPYELYEKNGLKKNFNGWTHRLVGHGHALDEPIPKHVLEKLEAEYGMPQEAMVKYWQDFQERLYKKVETLTGLPPEKAKAFVAFIWDLHLLGDLEPGNSAIRDVQSIEKIVDNITRHLKVLFGEDSVFVEKLRKKLLTILKDGLKTGRPLSEVVFEIAQRMMDEIMKSEIGGRLYLKYKGILKFVWNENVAINARAWIQKRILSHAKPIVQKVEGMVSKFKKMLSKSAKCKAAATSTGEDVTEKTVENTAKKSGQENTKTLRGILQKIYTKKDGEIFILSVHVPEKVFQGASAGVLTFVISEGISAVGLAKGEMTEDAFLVETGKNAGAALVDGLAVYAVCCFGFGPAGGVAIVVGVGSYVIYDIVFDTLYDINKFKGITLDDYLGVMPTEIQRRPSAFDYEGACKILDYEGESPGLGYEGNAPGLDYKGTNPGLGEVPNIRKDGFGL